MRAKFPNLHRSIWNAGATHRERAAKFGVAERTITRWLAGENQPQIDELVVYPPAVDALAEDARLLALAGMPAPVYDTSR